MLQSLHEGGLANYRVTEQSVVQLAAEPNSRRTVEALDDELCGGIRRLVFASNSVWDESLHSPLEFVAFSPDSISPTSCR